MKTSYILPVVVTLLTVIIASNVHANRRHSRRFVIRKAVLVFNVGVESSGIRGSLEFLQVAPNAPVLISGNLTNLRPQGLHGFHVHESGDIRQGCTSARGHLNPYNMTHGGPRDRVRHVGDLGNIVADENGLAIVDMMDRVISLNGDNSIVGRAKKADDLGKGNNEQSKITGNAGGRLGCGIIGVG